MLFLNLFALSCIDETFKLKAALTMSTNAPPYQQRTQHFYVCGLISGCVVPLLFTTEDMC